MNSHPAVAIDKLTKRFGAFTAVNEISLNISTGEVFGFLGANGAGKTTAIRMLCGLLMPTSGTGTVAGFDVASQPEQIKRSIGYMSQLFSLYPDLTGRENLSFYASAYGLDKATTARRITKLSDRLELGGFLDRIAGSLPLGWRQRLALAAATLHEPRLLFLDEPTSGVDPVFRRRFWSLLYELADEDITIFVTTHYMDEAEFCDRISIMHRGSIVELGPPVDLVRKHEAANLEAVFIQLISELEAAHA